MFAVFMLFATLGTAFAGYAGSSSNGVGNAYGYGYSGGYSGTGSGPGGNVPGIPNFDFEGLLGGYFDSFKKYHEHFINTRGPYAYAITSSSPNANVQAQSSITFVDYNRLQQQAQQAQQAGAQIPTYAPGYSSYGSVPSNIPNLQGRGSFGGVGDGGAVASAVIGPQGGYHTAAVYPENPSYPNIYSRFAETGQPGAGGGGSYGVFTSSVSSSSNTDGKPQSFHRATTTINDNGKISTYTVKNP